MNEIFMTALSPKNCEMTICRFAELRKAHLCAVLDYNAKIVTVKYRTIRNRRRFQPCATYVSEIPMDEFEKTYKEYQAYKEERRKVRF